MALFQEKPQKDKLKVTLRFHQNGLKLLQLIKTTHISRNVNQFYFSYFNALKNLMNDPEVYFPFLQLIKCFRSIKIFLTRFLLPSNGKCLAKSMDKKIASNRGLFKNLRLSRYEPSQDTNPASESGWKQTKSVDESLYTQNSSVIIRWAKCIWKESRCVWGLNQTLMRLTVEREVPFTFYGKMNVITAGRGV